MASRLDFIREYYNNLHRKKKINQYYNNSWRDQQVQRFYNQKQANARAYYNAALDAPGDTQSDDLWSNTPTLYKPNKLSLSGTSKLGAGIFIGNRILSSIAQGAGYNKWDAIGVGVRHFEEYFFARIPRTLQISNVISQFGTVAKLKRVVTPQQLTKYSAGQIAYLEKVTGRNSFDLLKHGLIFDKGKLSLGTGEVLLRRASVIRNLNKSHHFSLGYARSLGTKIADRDLKLFGQAVPFINHQGKEVNEYFQFIGGKNIFEHATRQLFGYGTEMVERANRLAKAPFDFPLVGPTLKKIFGKHTLGVRSGSGLETLARLTGKLGLLGGAAVIGYQTADWAVRNSKLFDHTIFDQGISAGIGTIIAKANLGYAKFGDVTGWRKRAEHQEQYAPGSTDLLKIAAFPILGAVGANLFGYGQRLALTARLEARGHSVVEASELAVRILHRFKGSGIVSSLGKTFANSSSSIIRSLGKSPAIVKTLLGAGIGLLPVIPFIFNALAPKHSEKELHDIYTGKQEVAIRKSRWWELGRTPFEGTTIDYYRPNWYARMMQRGKEHQIWDVISPGKELSPIEKFYKNNFTYDVELAHYNDRPYPITGQAFRTVPIIGPVLSATLGRFVKPPMYMHTAEFYNTQSNQFLQPALGFGADRVPGLGEQLPGAPISPHGIENTIGQQVRNFTELSGLPGFLLNTIKQKITGTQDLFDQETYLQSADQITSVRRGYYDLNLGGGLGATELLRRMIPSKQNQIETYNPIANHIASWLPGPGQRGPDLQHGDIYAAVPEGEIRMPGAGYATRFPELKGVDPEDYPLIHRYKILADVAPFSDQFGIVEKEMALKYKNHQLSDEDEELYHETQDQLKEKRNRKTFYNYKYRKQKLDPVEKALTDWNEQQKSPDEKPSWFEKVLGSYWETLAHNAQTPLEFLTPLSPATKLIHMQTALESYERNEVYGTGNAFWDKPWNNFLRPFLESSKHMLGSDAIPQHIKDKRNIESYFDILKYIKYTRLKGMAKSVNDKDATDQFEQKRRETLFGINPYTFDYTEIFRALPRRDRDYFNEFIKTKDINKRQEILKVIPENEKGLFVAKWKQSDATDFARAVKLGLLKQDEIDKGQKQLKDMYDDMSTEGLPKSQDLWKEYIKTRLQGESYPDWYRRVKLLPQKVKDLGMQIPGADFVGWNPAVDLDDVKLKLIQNMNESPQDYDLWPSREKALLYKNKFINDKSIAPIQQHSSQSESEVRKIVQQVLTEFKIQDTQIDVTMVTGNTHTVNMDIQHDRSNELKSRLRAH